MKKAYLFLLGLTAVMTPAMAEVKTTIVHVDNPQAVRIVYTTYDESYNQVEVSAIGGDVTTDNVVLWDDTDYSKQSLYIRANNDYKITSATYTTTGETIYNNGKEVSVYLPTAANYGGEVTITTGNLAELRTASCTINVDNKDKVKLTRSDYSEITLENGENTVAFDPNSEVPFMLGASEYQYSIYQVKLNGETMSPMYEGSSNYTINAQNGDVVDITADFPDEQHILKVTVPEGMNDLISSVTDQSTSQPVEGDIFAGISLQAGTKVYINLNTSLYAIDAITMNGEPYSGSSSISVQILDKDLTFDIAAHAFGTYTVNFNVNDAAHFHLINDNGQAVELTDGDNTVEVTEKPYPGSWNASVDPGYLLSIQRTNGETTTTVDYPSSFNVNKGDSFTVTVTEKTKDTTIRIWIADDAVEHVAALRIYGYENLAVLNEVQAGWNDLQFCKADLPASLYLDINHPDPIPDGYIPWSPYVLYNGSHIDFYGSLYLTTDPNAGYGTLIENGDVMRVFNAEPTASTVEVTYADGTEASAFTIYVDEIETAEAPLNAWAGCKLAVKWNQPEPDEAFTDTAEVKVDDQALTLGEDGLYHFTLTGNHSLYLASQRTVGIENVGADADLKDGAVYNLQGIRVADDSKNINKLPAGIYVTGGKKVVIR